MRETWNHGVSPGDLIYRDELLGDIRKNIISIIQDYVGRGIENEALLTRQANQLFQGDIVPSRTDWDNLNNLLTEISTIKEQGVMYTNFIQDVSNSLGVSDLEQIKAFIDYIQGLAPLPVTANLTLEEPEWYQARNLTYTTTNFWDTTNLAWLLTDNYLRKPTAVITFNMSSSEDIKSYKVIVKAGKFFQEHTRTVREVGSHTISLDWLNWFTPVQLKDASVSVQVITTDKRGNSSSFSTSATYPAQVTIPQGVSRYQVEYKRNGTNWTSAGATNMQNLRFNLPQVDGTYVYRVRALDKSGLYTEWAESTGHFIHFIPKPKNPTIQIGYNDKDWYKVINVKDSTNDDWDNAIVTWDLSDDYLARDEANIGFVINGSEEGVLQYNVTITAGPYVENYTVGPGGLKDKAIVLKWAEWLNEVDYGKSRVSVSVETIGIRNERLLASDFKYSPKSVDVARGVARYEVSLRIGDDAWIYPPTVTTKRTTYDLPRRNATYRWSIRALDKSGKYTAWAYSEPRVIRFIPDAPPKPTPKVTTTINEATITWSAVARAEYYEIWHGGEQWAKDNTKGNNRYWSKVDAGKTLSVTHKTMNAGREYTWNVRAVNEGGSAIGSTNATQKKLVQKTATYKSIGTNVWRAGYHRINKNWSKTWNGAAWRHANSKKNNELFQGEWHDGDWGGWKKRSGGYYAYGGQKWGNHASYIYLDYEKMRTELAGKKITKVEVTLTRKAGTHGWADAKPLYLYNHNKTANNNVGNIGMYRANRVEVNNNNQQIAANITFTRGETEVVNTWVTEDLIKNIVNGHMKGLGIVRYYGTYFGSNAPVTPKDYMRLSGDISIKVHYEYVQ